MPWATMQLAATSFTWMGASAGTATPRKAFSVTTPTPADHRQRRSGPSLIRTIELRIDDMKTNNLKTKLRVGQVVRGVTVGIAHPTLVEILGYVGFDFVIIDAEHGAIN